MCVGYWWNSIKRLDALLDAIIQDTLLVYIEEYFIWDFFVQKAKFSSLKQTQKSI